MKKSITPHERHKVLLGALLSEVVKKKNAALGSGPDVDLYIEDALRDFFSNKNLEPNISWIDKFPIAALQWAEGFVKEDFKSMNAPPNWLEPDWAFFEGVPMVFVGQLPDKNMIGGKSSRQIYIFKGLLISEQESPKEVYKLLIQEEDADGYVQSGNLQTLKSAKGEI